MGNLCSTVLRAIDCILKFLFPRYTAVLLNGYNRIIDESENTTPNENGFISPQTGESLTNSEDSANQNISEQDKISDNSSLEEAKINSIRDIVSDFFRNASFQQQISPKNTSERKMEVKDQQNNKEASSTDGIFMSKQYRNRYENVGSSKSEQLQKSIKNSDSSVITEGKFNEEVINIKDKAATFTRIEGKGNDSYLGYDKERINKIDTERNEHPGNVKRDNLNHNENSRNRVRKCGMIPTEEILKEGGQLVENFSDTAKQNISNECQNDGYSRDVKVGEIGKLHIRKLSLNRLQCGSHYSVNEENENIALSDFYLDSSALQVEVATFRKLSHPKLLSGGMVAFEELSEHLSLPNYYEENPIVYDEIPEGIKAPQSSPVILPSKEPRTLPRSSSGGGIACDIPSRKVCLPELYPTTNPLLRSCSPQLNTQSSASFGDLVTLKDEKKDIFSDLFTQSAGYDVLFASETTGKESSDN